MEDQDLGLVDDLLDHLGLNVQDGTNDKSIKDINKEDILKNILERHMIEYGKLDNDQKRAATYREHVLIRELLVKILNQLIMLNNNKERNYL